MTTELSKKLLARHVNMIAIGGSIGTGIFLASGYTVSIGGPGGALLAYALMACIVYFLMTSLAEMSAYKPTTGTFCEYSGLFVGKSFGVAMGYNYWLNWAITVAVDISAASLIMSYWFPAVSSVLFSLLFFSAIFIANVCSVRVYGEVEYFMSFIKVAIIIIFIVLGIMTIFYQPQFGTGNWTHGDAPFHSGFLGFLVVFLYAGFSFQGTELVGVASGETKNPEVTIPKSIKYVFWRLLLFYIVSITIITLLIPYDDPRLSAENVTTSPFTIIFSHYFSKYAADVVNFVILTAVLSAANASMYSSTRILWYLGSSGQAPKIFSKLNPYAIPIVALISSALVGSLVFLSSFIGNGTLFSYLIQISSLSGFIAWFGIALSHYKFRKDYLPLHGGEAILTYKSKFYPYAQIICMMALFIIVAAQFIPIIINADYKLLDILVTYSALILFAIFYFVHKYKTRL